MPRCCIGVLLLTLIVVSGSLPVRAEWIENGTPVCTDPSYQYADMIVPDGAGGAFSIWRDARSASGTEYAQHFDADGNMLWTPDGKQISSPNTYWYNIWAIPDGEGGFIVSWVVPWWTHDTGTLRDAPNDTRPTRIPGGAQAFLPLDELSSATASGEKASPTLAPDSLYIQRFDASGVPLWGDPGVLMPGLPSGVFYQVADGEGGAILVWNDRRNGPGDIYAQRISASGAVLWNPGGVVVCGDPANQFNVRVSSDGSGGAVITWMDDRDDYTHVYVQRVDALGNRLWGENGRRITTAPGVMRQPTVSNVGSGCVIVSWLETAGAGREIHALKLDGNGNAFWPDSKFTGMSFPSFSSCYVTADRVGGVIYSALVPAGSPRSVLMQRIDGDGVPLWGASGLTVAPPGSRIEMFPVADGSGGAYCGWIDDPVESEDNAIFVQWIRRTGEIMWEAAGRPLCVAKGGRWDLRGIDDGAGGALFHWTDARYKPVDRAKYDVFALRVFSEQPLEAMLDIRPLSCPNPLNPRSRGVLPVAVLGMEDMDVRDIDPASILLEGVAPLRWSFEDVAAASSGLEECSCSSAGPDGRTDLALKFETQAIVRALALGESTERRTLTLTIEGELKNGTRFEGSDCVVIVGKGPTKKDDGDGRGRLYAKSGPMDAVQEIGIDLSEPAFVDARVYDVSGRLVARLRQETMPAGVHTLRWDAGSVSSGIYFLKIEAGPWVETRKVPIYR
jgi:hypothetical protein